MHANVNHDCDLKRHTHVAIKHHPRFTTAAWSTSSSRFSSSFEQPHHASKFYSAALPATRLSSQKLVVTPCATLATAVPHPPATIAAKRVQNARQRSGSLHLVLARQQVGAARQPLQLVPLIVRERRDSGSGSSASPLRFKSEKRSRPNTAQTWSPVSQVQMEVGCRHGAHAPVLCRRHVQTSGEWRSP